MWLNLRVSRDKKNITFGNYNKTEVEVAQKISEVITNSLKKAENNALNFNLRENLRLIPEVHEEFAKILSENPEINPANVASILKQIADIFKK